MSEIRKRVRAVTHVTPVMPYVTPPDPTGWHYSTLHDAFADHAMLGMDLSLSATGLSLMVGSMMLSKVLTPPPKLRGGERLAWFHREFSAVLNQYQPALATVEGYARGAKFRREEAGEIGAIARLALFECGIPYILYSPTELKKFAIGGPGSDKALVARELYKRYGVDPATNDEVDACGLALMGAAYKGYLVKTTAVQREALAKLQ